MTLPFSPGSPRSALRGTNVVIVVEDDRAVRNSLQFSLEAEGYIVRLYADMRSLLAETEFPERGCVVADYFLPDGNGLELLHTLRAKGVALPGILLTSSPASELRRQAAIAKVPIVEKPLLGNALSEEIGAAIAEAF